MKNAYQETLKPQTLPPMSAAQEILLINEFPRRVSFAGVMRKALLLSTLAALGLAVLVVAYGVVNLGMGLLAFLMVVYLGAVMATDAGYGERTNPRRSAIAIGAAAICDLIFVLLAAVLLYRSPRTTLELAAGVYAVLLCGSLIGIFLGARKAWRGDGLSNDEVAEYRKIIEMVRPQVKTGADNSGASPSAKKE